LEETHVQTIFIDYSIPLTLYYFYILEYMLWLICLRMKKLKSNIAEAEGLKHYM